MFEWLSDKKTKEDREPTDWSKVSNEEIIDGLLGPERRPVMGRTSSSIAERDRFSPGEEHSSVRSSSLKPGPTGHIRDAEVTQMKDRLAEVNEELNNLWEGGGCAGERASLIDLVRERGEIERGLGRFGIGIDEMDQEIAEEQAVHQTDTVTNEEGNEDALDDSEDAPTPTSEAEDVGDGLNEFSDTDCFGDGGLYTGEF